MTRYELSYIETRFRKFVLSKPLFCEMTKKRNGLWFMIYNTPPLTLIGSSISYESCLEDFFENFEFVWECYGQESAVNLTKGGNILKRYINKLVKEVVIK